MTSGRAGAEVALRQVVVAGAGGLLLWSTPVGLGWMVPVWAASCAFGAWAWAVRRPDDLPRALVRGASVRAGLLWAVVGGSAYAAVASQPGQVALPLTGIALVSVVLGGLVGGSAAALSLCGADATAKVR
jgi:hypothetical protein